MPLQTPAGSDRAVREAKIQLRVRAYQRLADIMCTGLVSGGPRTKALVACTGTGLDAEALGRRLGPRGLVIALDSDHRMLGIAAERLRRSGCQGQVLQGLAQRPVVRAGRLDLVVCAFGLHYFSRPAQVLADWRDLLAPNGRIGLAMWGPAEPAEVFGAVQRTMPPLTSVTAAPDRHGLAVSRIEVLEGAIPYAHVGHFVGLLPNRPDVIAATRSPGGGSLTELCAELAGAASRTWRETRPVEYQRVVLLELRKPEPTDGSKLGTS